VDRNQVWEIQEENV